MIKIFAIQCSSCFAIIFSRAHHDFHYCDCGNTYVDGGFKYLRFGYEPSFPPICPIKIETSISKSEFYQDWNKRKNKFGIIKMKKLLAKDTLCSLTETGEFEIIKSI